MFSLKFVQDVRTYTLQSHRLAHFAIQLSAITNVGQNAHMCSKTLEWYEMADSHGMYYICSCMYACLFFFSCQNLQKSVFFVCVFFFFIIIIKFKPW